MMRYPADASAFGVSNVNACFSGVCGLVTKVVHLCCGYPEYLDQDDYKKADKSHYLNLVAKLDRETVVDEISVENAEAKNDLRKLVPLCARTRLILGSVAVARSEVETVEEIGKVAREAFEIAGKDEGKVVLAPDCGLGYLNEDVIKRKLGNMVTAAKAISS